MLIRSPKNGFEETEGSALRGELERSTLYMSLGSATIRVRGGGSGSDLFRARFNFPRGQAPEVQCDPDSGAVRIHGPATVRRWPLSRPRNVELTLNSDVIWDLRIDSGASRADLDLTHLRISRLQQDGGASQAEVWLPAPERTVPVELAAGASRTTVHRPAGVPVRVELFAGASSFRADGVTHRSLGGGIVWESAGYEEFADRYLVRVTGGMSWLALDAVG